MMNEPPLSIAGFCPWCGIGMTYRWLSMEESAIGREQYDGECPRARCGKGIDVVL